MNVDAGSSAYAVDLAALAQALQVLGEDGAHCAELLARVEARVERLHARWSGLTADSHAEAQRRWEHGFERMQDGLAMMRAATGAAEHNYRAAADANVGMWSW